MNEADQLDPRLSEEISYSTDQPVPCERLIGAAGTGKTFQLMKRVAEDPTYGLLTATTGISAVNLGAITINSTLRYSTVDVLKDCYLSGKLQRVIHGIARKHRRLIVEEYSMADADSLDLWYRGVQEANRYADVVEPLGILLVGDLAQLPPVKGRWCFEADCWGRFAENTTRLDKVWRQDKGAFLDALNFLRLGEGQRAMETLNGTGVVWETAVDTEFEGTTILPKNEMVNRYNLMGLDRIRKPVISVRSRRWGKERGEWANIPLQLDLKIGAYVMVLSNSPDFTVVNGDCGHVMDYQDGAFLVELKRTGKVVPIHPIVRHAEVLDEPADWSESNLVIPAGEDDGEYIQEPHYRRKVKRYVLGQIEYMPLRCAWASTVHKSQSLTLDSVQCDFRDHFFSYPAMLYVSLSRARRLEGLRLVGQKEKFIKQCQIDKRTLPWL